jgi:hypothetical protein
MKTRTQTKALHENLAKSPSLPSHVGAHSLPVRAILITLASMIILLRALTPTHDATYVPGAGFSGFWYSFGRVQHLPDNKNRDYHCFSAGCLVVSSVFLDKSYEDVAASALEIQGRWRDGDLSRYAIASSFVDDLLDLTGKPENLLLADPWLVRVQVLTSSWYTGASLTTAKNRGELRNLLIQTSFIPWATGLGFNHEGENDGGFSLLFHPRCKHSVMLPFTWTMIKNFLNVNMGMDTVAELYGVGMLEEQSKQLPRVA